MVDVTVVLYVSSLTTATPHFLQELCAQQGGVSLELIVVDGGTLRVDFNKMSNHCRNNNIPFSVIRQDPAHHAYPGFNLAAARAEGSTLVFTHPDVSIPDTFLQDAKVIGDSNHVVNFRPWANVLFDTGESCGLWLPPDGLTLVAATRYFRGAGLDVAEWPAAHGTRISAYVLSTQISRQYPGRVGVATLAGLERRTWIRGEELPGYAGLFDFFVPTERDNTLYDMDIQWFTRHGKNFFDVVWLVPPYRDMTGVEEEVHNAINNVKLKAEASASFEELLHAAQLELTATLDKMVEDRTIILRPEIILEPGTTGNTLRARSTGRAALPFESL